MICNLYSNDIFGAQINGMGIVTAEKLNVRSKPEKANIPFMALSKGTTVEISDQCDGWLKIFYKGQTGYIRNLKQYICIIQETEKNSHREIDQIKVEAKSISQKIEKHQNEFFQFTKKEATILDCLNQIDLDINKTCKRVTKIRSEIITLEKKIMDNQSESKNILSRIKANEAYASKRLVALYKITWSGRLQFLASAESIYEFFIRKSALARVLAYDETILSDLLEDKARLKKLLRKLNLQRAEKLSLETSYEQQIQIMSDERLKRTKVLSDIRNKKSLKIAAIENLKQAENDLEKAIIELKEKNHSSKNTKHNFKNSFTSLKGLLNMPVSGKIISFFGPYKDEKFNIPNFRNGIYIEADRGEPIHAVCIGKIIFSSWFKGYGNIVIIDHGNNYCTIYAHVEEIFKKQGDTVEKDEVIATVGDTGSLLGPRLYFEVRHHGKPIDPIEWIKTG
ncbi:MAG: peptidoglycan DD-metalloendopeptidase family protein [Desulfobacterales bacterium]|nr:peptidoglycan DD-metalloendopeptidase family protein [Desulfobacterales bacterium]